jgi:hypothetical protein
VARQRRAGLHRAELRDDVPAGAEPAQAVGRERRPPVDEHRGQHQRDQREHAGGQRAERELDAPVTGGVPQVRGEVLSRSRSSWS